MKRNLLLCCLSFSLAACAHHAGSGSPSPAPAGQPNAAPPPAQANVPAPLNAEAVRQVELLRAQGLELLYSKDPAVKNPKLAFEKLARAAAMGDPVSMDHLGSFYSSGTGGAEKSCEKALEWYGRAAALGYPMAVNNLAYTLVSCPDPKYRHPDKAEELMQTLFTNTPGLLASLDTYAAVLAENGNFKQAAKTLEVVIDLADFTRTNPEQIDEFRTTLARYRQRKTLRTEAPPPPVKTKKRRSK